MATFQGNWQQISKTNEEKILKALGNCNYMYSFTFMCKIVDLSWNREKVRDRNSRFQCFEIEMVIMCIVDF